eukprot:CCRYP_002317-RA/>CCRYP_002317-RA protein AED:0.32 eAED:0.30 QI:0/0/0/1/1/1/3/0/854
MIKHQQAPKNNKTNMIFMKMVEVEGQLFTNQTGRFPITSNRRHSYVMIFYAVDPNYIKSYPIKSRHCSEIIKAYTKVYHFLRVHDYCLELHKLDNATSKDVEAFTTKNNPKFHYTPDMHTNPAERVIRTWKNHFAAIHAGAPSTYRLSNWCKDLEQTDITLKMLLPCTTNPLLSAYEAMEGMFSFDRTPMAPIGTEAVTEAGAVRVSITFRFLHHSLPDQVITDTDRIIKGTQHLIRTINGKPDAPPDELQDIQCLKDLITGAAKHQCEPEPVVESESNPADEIILSDPIPSPIHISPDPIHTAPAARVNQNQPHVIPFDNTEYKPPAEPTSRYNLCSRNHIILTAIELTGEANAQGMIVSAVIDNETGDSLEYRHLIKHPKYKEVWMRSYANELGRPTNGIRDIPGTKTMQYRCKCDIPKDCLKTVAYSKIVVVECPQKKEKERTCLTAVRTYINYPWNKAVPMSDLTMAKSLFNSVIYTPGATFHGGDLKNVYLNTPMDRPEYMRLKFDLIPEEIVDKYKLREYNKDGWVYVRIDLGMYGLPQAGILANKLLAKRLAKVRYYQCKYTPGLKRHIWRPITFCLVVDDFGIKTVGLKHAKHLQAELEKYYKCSMDWKGDLLRSAPGLGLQKSSGSYNKLWAQPILAAALSSIASRQCNDTEATMQATTQLLNYVAIHPNLSIQYLASDMILALDTDGSYLSELGGKSRAMAYMFLTKKNNHDFHTGAILILSAIIKHGMASALENEIASPFYGCKEAIPHRVTLKEMGHPQPGPTPITTNNSTAVGLALDTMIPKASKSMDMRFQWLKCRCAQSLFKHLWAKGTKNRADYPSKHNTVKHHLLVCPLYVQDQNPI